MMSRRQFLASGGALAALAAFAGTLGLSRARSESSDEVFEVTKTEEEWRRILKPEQYAVLREEGTERPWTSPLLQVKEKGTYHCAGCDLPVFSSETKFGSGT